MTDEQQRQYERNYRTIMGTSDRKSKKDEQQRIVKHNSLPRNWLENRYI